MKKLTPALKAIIFIASMLLISLLFSSCSPGSYENLKYSNSYYLFNPSNLDSIKVMTPQKGEFVYNEKGEYNLNNFETIANEVIYYEGDTLYFIGAADYLYFDGDISNEQEWISEGQTNYLKINFPAKPEGPYYSLSVSSDNWK